MNKSTEELRAEFAGRAMQAWIPRMTGDCTKEDLARTAVKYADALIDALMVNEDEEDEEPVADFDRLTHRGYAFFREDKDRYWRLCVLRDGMVEADWLTAITPVSSLEGYWRAGTNKEAIKAMEEDPGYGRLFA